MGYSLQAEKGELCHQPIMTVRILSHSEKTKKQLISAVQDHAYHLKTEEPNLCVLPFLVDGDEMKGSKTV